MEVRNMAETQDSRSSRKSELALGKAETKTPTRGEHPLVDLRQEIDSLFDRFFQTPMWNPFGGRLFDVEPFRRLGTSFGPAAPKVDLAETDKELQITAEMPGMKESDVQLVLDGDMLTLKGEKTEQKEEEGKEYIVSERSFGRFERSFRLPESVDRERIAAAFENGVLTVTLPKTAESLTRSRRIQIAAKK
jgi:HSP20 family protein